MSVRLSEIGGLGTPQATKVYRSAETNLTQNVGPMYADARMTAGVYKAPKPPPPKVIPPISLDVLSRLSFADISALANAAVNGTGWSKGAASFSPEQVKVSVSNITVAYNAAANKAQQEEERRKAREEQTSRIVGAVKSSAAQTAQAIRSASMGTQISEISGGFEGLEGLGAAKGPSAKDRIAKAKKQREHIVSGLKTKSLVDIVGAANAQYAKLVKVIRDDGKTMSVSASEYKGEAFNELALRTTKSVSKGISAAAAKEVEAARDRFKKEMGAPVSGKLLPPPPVLKAAVAAVSKAAAQAKAGLKAKGTNDSALVVKKAALVATKAITSPQAAAVKGGMVAVAKDVAKALPAKEAAVVVAATEKAAVIKQAAANSTPIVKADATKKADAIVAEAVEKATEKKVEEAAKSAPSPEIAEGRADGVETPTEATEANAQKKSQAIVQAANAQAAKAEMAAGDSSGMTEVAPPSILPAPEQDNGVPEVIEAAPGASTAIVSTEEARELPGDDKEQVQEITSGDSDSTNITDASIEDGTDQVSGLGFLNWREGEPFYKQPRYWVGVAAVVGIGYWWWARSKSTRAPSYDITNQMPLALRRASKRR